MRTSHARAGRSGSRRVLHGRVTMGAVPGPIFESADLICGHMVHCLFRFRHPHQGNKRECKWWIDGWAVTLLRKLTVQLGLQREWELRAIEKKTARLVECAWTLGEADSTIDVVHKGVFLVLESGTCSKVDLWVIWLSQSGACMSWLNSHRPFTGRFPLQSLTLLGWMPFKTFRMFGGCAI